jgi:hypothetical protein
LEEHCRKRDLKIVSAASRCDSATHRLYSIDPFEWVDLFRRAECVITSTFHGLLYAIKYQKPVIFMVRGPSRAKSRLVLDRCNLHDRVVEEGQAFDLDHLSHALSPDNPTQLPGVWIKESREALRRALEE